jgi:hypothetical protein
LRTFHEKHQHGHPPEAGLLTAIKSLLDGSRQTFIIIDALDECPNTGDERRDLCNILEKFHSWAQPNLHLLVTSRKEADLCEALGSFVTLRPISVQDNVKSDISKYVRSKLASDPDLRKWSDEIRTEIEETLVEGAQGM